MAQPADPKSVLDAIRETHAEAEQIGGGAHYSLERPVSPTYLSPIVR
jgi:hypothetical protein